MELKNKIIKLRQEKGWTQYKLFKEAAISQSTLSRIESGEKIPNIKTLKKICNALGVSMAEFDDNNDKKNEAAQMLPRILKELESMKTDMTDEEKDLEEVLGIAKKIKNLSAKNQEVIKTIVDSLSESEPEK